MQIEKMSKKHIDEVYLISVEEFKENSWSKNLFIKEIEDNKFKISFVILINKIVAGFINLSFNDEEMTILNIATKKEFKRMGIATALIKKSVDIAKQKNLTQIFLEVEIDNMPAIKLYEKFGFEILKIRKNYYPNHKDAIEMLKKIKTNIE